jgi:tetratricopeptide (TPR) repeat protein
MQSRAYGWRAQALAASGLLVAIALVYAPVVDHQFLNFDDLGYVIGNPNLTPDPTLGDLLSHFVTPHMANWLPISTISLHLTYAIHGPNPTAFLTTNLVIHMLSVVILLAFLLRATGAFWPSVFAAGIFALHPLQVESVAWITERKGVLAGLFFMLGLYSYARYVEAPESRARYAAVVACFALGIMSKSSLITFPFVLLLLDHWPFDRLRGSLGARLSEKVPLFSIILVSIAATYRSQAEAGQMSVGDQISVTARALNAAESYGAYLADAVWPSSLAALYPHPYASRSPSAEDLAMGAALATALALATTAVTLLRTRRPYLLVGWLWFIGMLVPTIGLVQVGMQARADRYTYLPLIGLAIAFAFAATHQRAQPAIRHAAIATGLAALLALSLAARTQLQYWSDTITLHERMIEVTPDFAKPHSILGHEYARGGDNATAAAHFKEAARLTPTDTKAIFGLAVTRARLGKTDAAIAAYQWGLRLQPNKIRGHGELGVLLVEAGRPDEALPHLARALEVLPNEESFKQAQARAGLPPTPTPTPTPASDRAGAARAPAAK